MINYDIIFYSAVVSPSDLEVKALSEKTFALRSRITSDV